MGPRQRLPLRQGEEVEGRPGNNIRQPSWLLSNGQTRVMGGLEQGWNKALLQQLQEAVEGRQVRRTQPAEEELCRWPAEEQERRIRDESARRAQRLSGRGRRQGLHSAFWQLWYVLAVQPLGD